MKEEDDPAGPSKPRFELQLTLAYCRRLLGPKVLAAAFKGLQVQRLVLTCLGGGGRGVK